MTIYISLYILIAHIVAYLSYRIDQTDDDLFIFFVSVFWIVAIPLGIIVILGEKYFEFIRKLANRK